MASACSWSALVALLVAPATVFAERLPLRSDGIVVDAKGAARVLVQPEFRGAVALHAALIDLKVPGLSVHLVAPRVVTPTGAGAKPKPPVLSRLLLRGPEAAVRRGLAILRRLDHPPRSVRVCLTIAEMWGRKYTERGGSLLFDRVSAPDQTNTMFRSFRIGFQPNEFLRAETFGLRPAEGLGYRLFSEDFYDNLFAVTMNGQYARGRASYVARPNLLLNEGETGTLQSLREVPQLLFSGSAENPVITQRGEEVGIKVRVVPLRITPDEALLELDVWFRFPQPTQDTGSPVGTLILKERRVQTRVRVRDSEPILISGLRIRRNDKDFMSPLSLLPPIDPIFATVQRSGQASEIWFVIRATVREPRIDPTGTTHHAWR